MEQRLIHADSSLNEMAQVIEFDSFSASITTDRDGKNDWELTMPAGAWKKCPVETGHYIYIDGSEWGGPVERVRHISSEGQIKVSGTCWRGLLDRRVISPAPGNTHYILEETEANGAIARLMDGWRDDLFAVSGEDSGLLCSGSLRYDPLLKYFDDMLGEAGGRLSAVFSGGKVLLSAVLSRDMSDEVELSQEYNARLKTDSSARVCNHIIALGRGEMLDRQVVELWLLPDGTVSSDPPEEDFPVSTLLYDYSAVESPEELKRSARSALLSHAGRNTMEISMTDRVGLELTDTAAVRDTLTGMTALLRVTGQELTINSSGLTLTHHLE